MKISCAYKIINTINNKIYIGSTIDWRKRKVSHKNQLNRNRHKNSYLQRAWNKYGEIFFQFEILEQADRSILIEKELYYINLYDSHNNGYNIERPNINKTGFEHSPLTKSKISVKKKGQGHLQDTRRQISDTMKLKVVPNRSQSSYDKMATTKKGKPILKCRKKVKCIELDKIFDSIQIAADELKLQRTGISMVLNGTIQKTGGYTFERVI